MAEKRPTVAQLESTLATLLWLHENVEYGDEREAISLVRFLLSEMLEQP